MTKCKLLRCMDSDWIDDNNRKSTCDNNFIMLFTLQSTPPVQK